MTDNAKPADLPAPTDAGSFRARSLDVSLTVNDLAKSLAWYQEAIGFTISQRHERDGQLFAVSLAAGEVRILLGRDDGAMGKDRVKGAGFSFQFTTDQDIDALAKRITDHGGVLDSQPADMPWGVRAFRLRDPDGFRITMSSVRPASRS